MFQETTEEFINQVKHNPYDGIRAFQNNVILQGETYTLAGELVDSKLITAAQGCIFISLNFVKFC